MGLVLPDPLISNIYYFALFPTDRWSALQEIKTRRRTPLFTYMGAQSSQLNGVMAVERGQELSKSEIFFYHL